MATTPTIEQRTAVVMSEVGLTAEVEIVHGSGWTGWHFIAGGMACFPTLSKADDKITDEDLTEVVQGAKDAFHDLVVSHG